MFIGISAYPRKDNVIPLKDKPLFEPRQIKGLVFDCAMIAILTASGALTLAAMGGANLGFLNGIGSIGHYGAYALLGASGAWLVANTIASIVLMTKRVSEFKQARDPIIISSNAADLENRIGNLEEANALGRNVENHIRELTEELKNRAPSLRGAMGLLGTRVSELSLEEQLTELQVTSNDTQTKLTQEIESLRGEIANMETSQADGHRKNTELENQIQIIQNEYQKLQENMTNLQAEIDTRNDLSNKALKENRDQLVAERAELEQRLSTLQEKSDLTKAQLEQQVNELNSQKTELVLQNQQKVVQLENDIAELKNQINTLNNELQEKKDNSERTLIGMALVTEKQLKEKSTKSLDQGQQIERLQSQIIELKTEIKNLKDTQKISEEKSKQPKNSVSQDNSNGIGIHTNNVPTPPPIALLTPVNPNNNNHASNIYDFKPPSTLADLIAERQKKIVKTAKLEVGNAPPLPQNLQDILQSRTALQKIKQDLGLFSKWLDHKINKTPLPQSKTDAWDDWHDEQTVIPENTDVTVSFLAATENEDLISSLSPYLTQLNQYVKEGHEKEGTEEENRRLIQCQSRIVEIENAIAKRNNGASSSSSSSTFNVSLLERVKNSQ